MKFKPNKITLAVFGCLGLYSPTAFAANIWDVEMLYTESNTLKNGTAIAKVNTPASSNINNTNYICLNTKDGNLDFTSSGNDLIIKRKVDANGVVINGNLAAAVCSDGIAEGLNDANCADSTANGQLYYQMTAKTQSGTSCNSLSGGSFNFSVSESTNCSATNNYSFANNTITYTGPELTTTAEKTVYLCGNNLNTGNPAYQAISFTVTGESSGGNAGGGNNSGGTIGDYAGERYVKLSASNGNILSKNSNNYGCVWDRGADLNSDSDDLIWEIKQNSGLHHKEYSYRWWNGDSVGLGHGRPAEEVPYCNKYSSSSERVNCDTYSFVKKVNTVGWCGIKGSDKWRLPTKEELRTTSSETQAPKVDNLYVQPIFKNTQRKPGADSSIQDGLYLSANLNASGLSAYIWRYDRPAIPRADAYYEIETGAYSLLRLVHTPSAAELQNLKN